MKRIWLHFIYKFELKIEKFFLHEWLKILSIILVALEEVSFFGILPLSLDVTLSPQTHVIKRSKVLSQGSAHFFYKWPVSKYFRFCGPYSLIVKTVIVNSWVCSNEILFIKYMCQAIVCQPRLLGNKPSFPVQIIARQFEIEKHSCKIMKIYRV